MFGNLVSPIRPTWLSQCKRFSMSILDTNTYKHKHTQTHTYTGTHTYTDTHINNALTNRVPQFSIPVYLTGLNNMVTCQILGPSISPYDTISLRVLDNTQLQLLKDAHCLSKVFQTMTHFYNSIPRNNA